MGKTMDALLRRNFKTAKFKALVNLAISRLAVFKNQRQVRCVHARSDTAQLLNLGHQDRALLRAEVVIKEQNMLDVFVMIEGYCHILIERAVMIEHNRECPDELKEAISSLIFAASRCGEFPELQEIRSMIVSRFGKDAAARAVELRNNCGVNQKMIQKLSTRHPSREIRMQVLQEIASENGIVLHIEEEASVTTKVTTESQKQFDEIQPDEQTSGSRRTRQKYADVASAAQAAFESAAYAAAAAKAAVELSRSDSLDFHPNDQSNPTSGQRNRSGWDESPRSALVKSGEKQSTEGLKNSISEPEDEEMHLENHRFYPKESEGNASKESLKRSPSDSSLDSTGNSIKETKISSSVLGDKKPLNQMIFDKSDDETETGYKENLWSNANESGSGIARKFKSVINEYPKHEQNNIPMDTEEVNSKRLNIQRRPISVRTRGRGR